MAQHRRDFSHGPEFVDAAKNLVDIRGVLRLRQRNNNGQWAPYGKFGQGNALIDTWNPKAPIQVTGFMAETKIVGSDQILFRLSPDGDVTELWWNGTAWDIATDPLLHWNPEDVVDAHIATFPIGSGISQIVRFVSSDGTTTPELVGTSIYYEVQYEPMVDFLNSLARRIAGGLTIQGVFQVTVPPVTTPPTAPSNLVTVDDPIWTLNDPIQVFNDTTDPNRRTNLYVSRASNVLTLSGPQTGLLTVLYTATLDLSKIHIATDADVEKAELPAIVLQTPTSIRRRYENTFEDYEEVLRSLGVVRRRKSATFEEVRVHIQCNAAWDLHARKLRDAVRDFIEEDVETLQSIALDESLVRMGVGPFAAAHDLPEQTSEMEVQAVFSVLNWPVKYRDVPLATETVLNIWPVSTVKPPTPSDAFMVVDINEVEGPDVPSVPTDEKGELQYVSMSLSQASVASSRPIPDNVVIRHVILNVTSAYSPGTTILIKRAGGVPVIMDTNANQPGVVGTYAREQVTSWDASGDGAVSVVVSGGPLSGEAIVYIGFMTPQDIG